MTSFADFLATFDADPGKRGRQFEHFVKWFLTNDPEWATQVDEVWLWQDYPGQWGRDCGIDLVFRDKIGGIWAVQAKCYSPNYEITKADVDKFLSESNRKQINQRLLIATTDGTGANARQVLDAQEKPVVRYLLNHFEDAKVDYPNSIKELSTGKRKPPPEPDRLHQIEAVDAVLSGFQTASRGQLIMACGTGKTFVCLWVKEQLKAKRTLVLVPSLNLLSQMLSEWTFAAREPFDALCVCSDQTVNRDDDDKAISIDDFPFPVSNDVNEIADFLKADNDQVIFSTYQSSPLIAQAQKRPDVPHFDLVIADEAHRCAGKSDTVFGTVLDDRLIKSDRRLFATATPRVYRTSLKKAAEEFGVEVVDMNDEERFGKRFHTLTFGEAIKREQLTDYRVVIVGVDDERVREWIENRRLVATDTGLATDARSLAGQIGLLKAIKDWNLRRLISFHGRVKGARVFSEDIIQVAEWLDHDHKPSGNLWADHVSGEMPTIARKQKLKRLKNVGNGEIGLLSNARCLSEGVDVPALDGVAFIDPRSSEIDIIQSVGRAIRLSENKTMGTIVIPVFIDQADNAEETLRASEFKPIWDVLEALKSHDERLSDELDKLRIELGAKTRRSVGTGDLTKIVFDLPTSVNEEFAQSLRTYLVEQTTESWMFGYGMLESYKASNGDCWVPWDHKVGEFNLGSWVSYQRNRRYIMSRERRQRLDAIGFVWNRLESGWEEGFAALTAFKSRVGHCNVPSGALEGASGFKLGQWVRHQRRSKGMTPERKQRLDAIGFEWNQLESAWEEGFEALAEFKSRHGHCAVPQQHVEGAFALGSWVSTQRVGRHMSAGRRQRLDAIGFVWDRNESGWEEGFAALTEFRTRHGHCRVPQDHRDASGFRLGRWVGKLRREGMTPERKQRLDAIGFVWDPLDRSWEDFFAALIAFKSREGHCVVPDRKVEGALQQLAKWVSHQRNRKKSMSAERITRLDQIGFAWDPQESKWEEGFTALRKFNEREGNCRVPISHVEGAHKLGAWVSYQRRRKDGLSDQRKRRLETLPGWVWKVEK